MLLGTAISGFRDTPSAEGGEAQCSNKKEKAFLLPREMLLTSAGPTALGLLAALVRAAKT